MNTEALKSVPSALLAIALASKQAGASARELDEEIRRYQLALSLSNSKRAKRRVKR